MMLPKRFHDDNESIVALKRFCIYKNRENVGKCWSMDLEWNGTGGFQKCWSRESIRVRKDIRRLQETSEMLECGIGKHREYGKHWKTSEMLEYGIGRHQKHWSVK